MQEMLLAHVEPALNQQRLSTEAPHAQVRTLQNSTVRATVPPPKEGDVTAPERIAGSAAAFLDAHLRMKDVRQYLLDLLKTYAALQTFQVRNTGMKEEVLCHGELMLELGMAALALPKTGEASALGTSKCRCSHTGGSFHVFLAYAPAIVFVA